MGSTQLGIQRSNLIEKVGGKKDIGLMGISLVSVEKYIPEWLTNATKCVTDNLPKFAPKFVGAATTVLTASKYLIASVQSNSKKR
jgi:hypothetical protein